MQMAFDFLPEKNEFLLSLLLYLYIIYINIVVIIYYYWVKSAFKIRSSFTSFKDVKKLADNASETCIAMMEFWRFLMLKAACPDWNWFNLFCLPSFLDAAAKH